MVTEMSVMWGVDRTPLAGFGDMSDGVPYAIGSEDTKAAPEPTKRIRKAKR